MQFDGTLNAGYDLIYAYAKNPQQISTIGEESYRTEDTAAVVPIKKNQIYSYDANGNLVSVNTNQYTIADKLSKSNQRRFLWDEENRLLALSDNGYVSN
ncbi:MAG: RHS repeat-associated core domain-containing protein, partial [Bacteroidales bacterium]